MTRSEGLLQASASARRGVPALLVSVRNAAEAIAALSGGCEILDVKEPSDGPLGMASVEEIQAIVAARNAVSSSVPVSVALGELLDWSESAAVPRLGTGISYLKFGTSRLAASGELCQRFLSFCSLWEPSIESDEFRKPRRDVIAVAYADWQAAYGPHPCEVAEAVAGSDCRGLLIDTFCKTGGGLFEHIPVQDLNECAAIVRKADRTFALAGRLGLHDVKRALELGPDLLGIRSAACRNGRREFEIDARAVDEFRRAMMQAVP